MFRESRVRGFLRPLPPGPRIGFRSAFTIMSRPFIKFVAVFVLGALISGSARAQGESDRNPTLNDAAALAEAERTIERIRKGDARIEIRGFAGSDLRVRVKQISHDFKFGCYLKIDGLSTQHAALYEKHFGRIFNYAVIGTYWDVTENKRGVHFWENFKRETAMAKRNRWRVQAAPILWGTSRAGSPEWLPKDPDALRRTVSERIDHYFQTNPGAAVDIEVVNEPLAPAKDIFVDSLGREYVDAAFRRARAISPDSRLLINEYGVFGFVAEHNYNTDRYFEYLDAMNRRRIPFDVVGIQAHANREWYRAADVRAKLDRYAQLGKPIQITEFSAQTRNYDDRSIYDRILGNFRSGTWSDKKQAEFYREFYTIAFGHPAVEAVVQWGLDDARAWLPGIGVVDENLKPKPNYLVLDELINTRWRTNLELETKGAKTIEFRGFFGVYEIEVISGGKSVSKRVFELRQGAPNNFLVINE